MPVTFGTIMVIVFLTLFLSVRARTKMLVRDKKNLVYKSE